MSNANKTIIITGGASFIGSAVVRHLINHTSHQVINIDKLTYAGNLESLASIQANQRYVFEQVDICDTAEIIREKGKILLPQIPVGVQHNAHMFYLKVESLSISTNLIKHMNELEIMASFHYVPLHTTMMAKKYGLFSGNDVYTTKESERIIRLTMYCGLTLNEMERVVESISVFLTKMLGAINSLHCYARLSQGN